MSEFKYSRRVRYDSNDSDELDYLNHLNRFPTPIEAMDLVGKMEPNIFVTGGVARQAALMEICGLQKDELPVTTDCDFLSFSEGGIYKGNNKTPVAAIYVGYNRSFDERFRIFLDMHTALTIDQIVMGSPKRGVAPELYVTDEAVQDYQDRVIRISSYQSGECRSTKPMVAFSSVCRAAVMGEILRPQGFTMGVDRDFAKQVLREGWSHSRSMGKLRSAVNKSKLHGVQDGLSDYFGSLGFSIPRKIIEAAPYVSEDEF